MTENSIAENIVQHTPGPWVIHPPVRGYAHSVMAKHPKGTRIACADIPEGLDADGNDSLGNARLIAAAPDLLAALKAITYFAPENPFSLRDPRFSAWPKMVEAAQAAIAKAEGRS